MIISITFIYDNNKYNNNLPVEVMCNIYSQTLTESNIIQKVI